MNDQENEDRWKILICHLRDNGILGSLADKLDPPKQKRKRVVYVNVCADFMAGFRVDLVRVYDTRGAADSEWRNAAKSKYSPTRLACIRVELEEGRFDE